MCYTIKKNRSNWRTRALQDYFSLSMTTRDVNQISALGLAHCGDAAMVCHMSLNSYTRL